jgi:Mlo family
MNTGLRINAVGPLLNLQALMVVTVIYLLVLSLNTMPLYCLVVQMGGDFKAHLLPHELASHMTMVAHEREQARPLMVRASNLVLHESS